MQLRAFYSPSALYWGAWFAIQAGIAVAAGAFGAHGLQSLVDAKALSWWQTASQYLMYHALAGLIVVALSRVLVSYKTCLVCLSLGNLFFAGSLYAMTLTGVTKLGAITPIGGLCYLVAWGALAYSLYRCAQQSTPL
ncbi:DUF423 domain-containing protein [Marinomonas epiphytica]